MSDAVSATGTLLKIGSVVGGGGTYLDIVPELLTITPPAQFRNPIETTTHNDGEESHVMGIRRSDTIAFRVNWVVSAPLHQQLESDFQANTKRSYRIEYPDATKMTFDAYVERWSPVEATPDSAKQIEGALRKAGLVTTTYV